jgi:hypothetical protein
MSAALLNADFGKWRGEPASGFLRMNSVASSKASRNLRTNSSSPSPA